MGKGSGKKVTVGYKYFLGVHKILCHGPIDSIKKITADDKELWSGTSTGATITINKPTIFGGDEREGGVRGDVDVALGDSSQTVNSYLSSKLGALTPAFRGVAALILKQVYIGNSAYPKAWVIRASRINTRTDGSNQWYSTKAAIGSDMNPAHIIVECLTNGEWGMGYNDTDIDLTSFQSAADTLHSEGMGISLLWDKGASIEEFIQEILNHIDGSMFVDKATGRFTLKLARANYTVGSLLTLDESNIDEISDLKRSTQDELYNSITVVYWDSATGKDGSVTVTDIALIAQRGHTVGEKLEFPGFSNGVIANKVAMRELKTLSTPLLRCTIIANRAAADLNVADVFKLNWPRNGITNVVMRVASIDLGTSINHSVKIECVEDVFALGTAVYSTPPASGWVSPSSTPSAMPYRSVIEAPYWELAKRAGDTVAQATDPTFGYVVATGTRPSGDALNADLMTNPTNTGYVFADKVDFCPTAVLAAAVSPAATSWTISNGADLDDVVLGTYALIDNEFVSVVAISDTTMTVGRGVLDTVPAAHAISARIMFVDDFYQVDGQEYVLGETARIKMLPTTGDGTLDIASAPENTVVMNSRLGRPYPPGQFKIDTLYYPTSISTSIPSVTWAHRDRKQQTATLIDHTAGSIGPEVGVDYKLQVLDEFNSVVTEVLDIAGTSQSVDLRYLPTGTATIKVWSDRGGLLSLYPVSNTFTFPLDPLFLVLSLTYDEQDHLNEMTWTRSGGAGPHITPGGFEGNGYNARMKSTTIPAWLSGAGARVAIQATLKVWQNKLKTTSGDTILHLGQDTTGATPRARLAFKALQDPQNAGKIYVGLQAYTTSTQTQALFRPEWKFQGLFPTLVSSGQTVRPQGLLFIDSSTLLVCGHYNDTETKVFRIDLSSMAVTGTFSFGTSTNRHVASFAANSAGDVWCVDYETGNTLKLDLTNSFSSGSAVITATWNTSVLNKVSGIAFITVSSVEYVLLSEYATTGTPYIYVVTASSMVNGATFNVADRYKRFSAGLRLQGSALKDGHLWLSRNVDVPSSTTYGWVERYDNFGSTVSGTADGATISANYRTGGPSQYPEDIKFHPSTGEMWTMTEGWASVVDQTSFLSIWSSTVDGTPAENHVSASYNGSNSVTVKLNNKDFISKSWSITEPVAVVSVGGPPQASDGMQTGFFSGFIKNIRIQNLEISSTDYSNTVAGTTYEPNSLTAYVISLTNSGAESGVTGWTDEVGTIATRSANPAPYAGSAYFSGGSNAQTISRQRADLLSATGLSGAQVDAGGIWAKVRWQQASFTDQDPGSMGIRLLDTSQAAISTNYGGLVFVPYGDSGTTPNWYARAYPSSISSGTRYIDALYRGDRTSGTNLDTYIDAIELVVYRQ